MKDGIGDEPIKKQNAVKKNENGQNRQLAEKKPTTAKKKDQAKAPTKQPENGPTGGAGAANTAGAKGVSVRHEEMYVDKLGLETAAFEKHCSSIGDKYRLVEALRCRRNISEFVAGDKQAMRPRMPGFEERQKLTLTELTKMRIEKEENMDESEQKTKKNLVYDTRDTDMESVLYKIPENRMKKVTLGENVENTVLQVNDHGKITITKIVLKEGDEVKSESGYSWTVPSKPLFCTGTYGDTFRVFRKDKEKNLILGLIKTEANMPTAILQRLKVEIMVLKELAKLRETLKIGKDAYDDNFWPFVGVIDSGKVIPYRFIVFPRYGPSLEDLRKFSRREYDVGEVLYMGMFALSAIEHLHSLGYIHRDIKPSSFVVDEEMNVCLIDFGLAKMVWEAGTKQLKPPRSTVPFVGTALFASRAAQAGRECSFKDDCEAWVFTWCDLMDSENGLPWKRTTDANRILDKKNKFFEHRYPRVYNIVPKKMKTIVDKIGPLTYRSESVINECKSALYSMSSSYPCGLLAYMKYKDHYEDQVHMKQCMASMDTDLEDLDFTITLSSKSKSSEPKVETTLDKKKQIKGNGRNPEDKKKIPVPKKELKPKESRKKNEKDSERKKNEKDLEKRTTPSTKKDKEKQKKPKKC